MNYDLHTLLQLPLFLGMGRSELADIAIYLLGLSEILGIDLPDKVELVVTHTEPAVKGNTTQNALKDATCETGLMVRVPLFIEEGETIIVSTADSKYVSRA